MPSTVSLRSDTSDNASATVAMLDDRQVMLVETGSGKGRGALTPADSMLLQEAFRTARDKRLPIVTLLSTSGVSVDHGISSVTGWGRAAKELVKCSGVVPILFAACGPVLSGPAFLLGIADITVFTEDAYAFVSGPQMVEAFTGVPITTEALGGAGTHARSSGLASLVVADREEALEAISAILYYLPSHVDEFAPTVPTSDPVTRQTTDAASTIPDHATGSYNVKDIIEDVVDEGEFLELRASWAPNLVTGFASIGGHSVGVVANQSQALAGAIDIPASQKGARFVAMCDAFGIPLLTLVDTSGFLPGKDLEWRGMIRHGAQLAFAYARATVPRISLILRKSYGGAYIVMDSRYMGNDMMLAWPSAEVAVMGAKGAVEILHRKASPEARVQLEADYEAKHLTPYPTAERGSISAVIDPLDTRTKLAAGFELLASKREKLRERRHDNSPL